jgi:hypothetical protein
MIWKKLGLIFCGDGRYEWMQSHAFLPTPILVSKDIIRVFVAFVDQFKVGRIGYVDVDAYDPRIIRDISKKPVLDIGESGTFDESGVTPSSVVVAGNNSYMLYFGWQLGVNVRYYLFTGLAINQNNDLNHFIRVSRAPILDRTNGELFVRSGPFCMFHDNIFKIWYVAGDTWINVNGKIVPTYNLRYLTSPDLKKWSEKGEICLSLSSEDEYGFGRPFVLIEEGKYKLWYSIRTRSQGYRLGYAESEDGVNWIRKNDQIGIDVSETGWDSEMICYSAIIDAGEKRYMFYNGNNYGETGFGVAVLEK